MTRIRFRTIPLVLSLAAMPALASAKPAAVALDACARQIVSDFATRQGLAPKYTVKLDERQALHEPADASVYRFTLVARNPKSGAVVAYAQCDAGYDGRVISYRTLPLSGAAATFARSE